MSIQIKNIYGTVLFDAKDAQTMLEAVNAAVAARANLRYANLRSANLSYASLSYADLSYADLSSASLSYANLSTANLSYANLSYAELRYANLSTANLSYAELRYAELRYANLSTANLSSADLSSASLSSADLSSANLSTANLSSADLSSASLSSADLSSANLRYAENTERLIIKSQIVPQEGDFIAWKKLANGKLAKLLIPDGAKRVGGLVGRKCRAEHALVLDGDGTSRYDPSFIYKTGETVKPAKPFCDDPTQECASGIHFFITKEEAEDYND